MELPFKDPFARSRSAGCWRISRPYRRRFVDSDKAIEPRRRTLGGFPRPPQTRLLVSLILALAGLATAVVDAGPEPDVTTERFRGNFAGDGNTLGVGIDLYAPPEFEGGLIVFGEDVAMKLGGYVKADFIYDFDPIDATDSFATTTIPVGAPDRTNTRFHARQTRFSFDTRWDTGDRVVQIFLEGDFFSDGGQFRLRHAYGEKSDSLRSVAPGPRSRT